MKIRIKKTKNIDEMSSASGGAFQGYPKDDKIEEMFSTAGIYDAAGGSYPKERSPEGHKKYVRLRFTRQGLQNFKPNRYFPSKDQQLGEKWSRGERKKRKSKCSNPKGFTMKQFCKNQRTKSKKGERKNENKNKN